MGVPHIENAFGKNLRQLRMRQGMRQEDVAEALAVPTDTYSAWELGWELPDNEYMPKIAELYGADPEELFVTDPSSLLSLKPETMQRLLERVEDKGTRALLLHEMQMAQNGDTPIS